MSSPVDICNMALAAFGEPESLSSIDPPEGGQYAERIAREYISARDFVLEEHDWTFATKRTVLAKTQNDSFGWEHAYARPSDATSIIAVIPSDDKFFQFPAPFACENSSEGARLILCDLDNASCRYRYVQTNTATYSEAFCSAVAFLIAAKMAGVVIQGKTSIEVSASMMKSHQLALAQAIRLDMKQRRHPMGPAMATWNKARGYRHG